MMRLLWCETKKLSRSVVLYLFLASAALFSMLLILSGRNEQFFMIAGPQVGGALPEKIGGAIGFIVNTIDPERVADSVIRTVFSYTIFWIPSTVLFSAGAFTEDFSTRSIILSKARGVSVGKIMLAKVITWFSVQGLCYGIYCVVSLVIKAAQFGTKLQAIDFKLFFGVLAANVLLLWVLSLETFFLFALLKNVFASVLILLIYHAAILSMYPNTYARFPETLGGHKFVFQASPVYYLMNSCSLSFDRVPLQTGIHYSIAALVLLAVVTALVLENREV